MSIVFISHQNNDHDNAWASKLRGWLVDNNHESLFLDFHPDDGIQGGERWEATIHGSLWRSDVLLALISQHWAGSKWCFAEAIFARGNGKTVIPLLIEPDMNNPFEDTQHIDMVGDEIRGFEKLRAALSTHIDIDPNRSPYPGLRPFDEADAGVFFGRDQEIGQLFQKLDGLRRGGDQSTGMLLLLGASGSGKSSLVRAGLIPRMRHHDDRWRVTTPIIPGPKALTELDGALQSVDQEQRTTLIVIDQAERLLRQDQEELIERLNHACDLGHGRVITLFTLRADQLDPLLVHPLFNQPGDQGPVKFHEMTLRPVGEDQLDAIITKPARLHRGVRFEEKLVHRLIDDAGGTKGLPMLAFFLAAFWDRSEFWQDDHRLTLDDYVKMGGIGSTIERAADLALDDVKTRLSIRDDAACRRAVRDAFIPTLIDMGGSGGKPIGRTALMNTIDAQTQDILGPFIDAGLVRTSKNHEGDVTIELAHEALIEQWQQLKDWVGEDREQWAIFSRVERAAADWELHNQASDRLRDKGELLAQAAHLFDDPRFSATAAAASTAYLAACAGQEAASLKRSRQIRTATIAAAVMFALLSATLTGGIYLNQQITAEKNKETSKRLTAIAQNVVDQDPIEAIKLTVQALPHASCGAARPPGNNDAATLLHQAVFKYSTPVAIQSLGAPKASQLVADDQGLRLIHASRPARGTTLNVTAITLSNAPDEPHKTQSLGTYEANFVALSRDGRRMAATLSRDNRMSLIDLQTQSVIGAADHNIRALGRVFFSHDDETLAVIDDLNSVSLFNARTLDKQTKDPVSLEAGITSLAFAHQGNLIALGMSNGEIRLWTMNGPDLVEGPVIASDRTSKTGHKSGIPVRTVAFSPVDQSLVSADERGSVWLWPLDGEAALSGTEIFRHQHATNHVSFSPDGRLIQSVSSDQSSRIYDRPEGEVRHRVNHGKEIVYGGFAHKLDPSRGRLFTISKRGDIEIHNAKTFESYDSLRCHAEALVANAGDAEDG